MLQADRQAAKPTADALKSRPRLPTPSRNAATALALERVLERRLHHLVEPGS